MSAPSSRRARVFNQARTLSIPRERLQQLVAQLSLPLLEIAIITIWALFVGRDYLNFDPAVWPAGREYPSAVQTHFVWTLLPECGDCVFWNGFVRGGAPAFAELHGSLLHPLVIVSTLLLGVVNGSKVVLVASLLIGGIAQWWIAKAMRLSFIPRLWSALLVVAGGHLAARMELGTFGVILSTAACSLVFAAAVDLALNERPRATLLLALTLAVAIVSGQGYLQVGLLLGIAPAFIFLLVDDAGHIRPVWKQFALAGGLALLMAGVFLVPMLHFFPNFFKPFDPAFSGAQPLAYAPLNLLIDDPQFYLTDALQKLPYPYLYANFIGWVPVLLLFPAVHYGRRSRWSLLAFYFAAIFFVFLASSAHTLKLIGLIAPTLAHAVRFPSLISSLAVPPLVALSAWGLELLLQLNRSWPSLSLSRTRESGSEPLFSISLLSLTLAPLLLWSLFTVHRFSQHWLYLLQADDNLTQVVERVQTQNTQWVGLPFGEHHWMIPALKAGLKVSGGIRAWDWEDRALPSAVIEVADLPDDQVPPGQTETINGLNVLTFPENQYAYVLVGTGKIPCPATAKGGYIDVRCNTTEDGMLVVQENVWSGWQVTRDGRPVDLQGGPWLATLAPAGEHTYQFRYRPWDVPLGLSLTVLGLGLTAYLWFNPRVLQSGPFRTVMRSEPERRNRPS